MAELPISDEATKSDLVQKCMRASCSHANVPFTYFPPTRDAAIQRIVDVFCVAVLTGYSDAHKRRMCENWGRKIQEFAAQQWLLRRHLFYVMPERLSDQLRLPLGVTIEFYRGARVLRHQVKLESLTMEELLAVASEDARSDDEGAVDQVDHGGHQGTHLAVVHDAHL